jgi:hypothetical protein
MKGNTEPKDAEGRREGRQDLFGGKETLTLNGETE